MQLSHAIRLIVAGAALLASAALAGCTGGVQSDPPPQGDSSPGDPLSGLESLTIAPENPSVTVSPGHPLSLKFQITGTFSAGESRDVTQHVALDLQDPLLGSFEGAELTTSSEVGGSTLVVARAGEISVQTPLTVKVELGIEAAGAPQDAGSLFGSASCGGAGPILVYPESGTLVPPNLGEIDVMWTDDSHDLWELTLQSATVDIKIYTVEKRYRIHDQAWRVMSSSNLEDTVTVSVRGLTQAGPNDCGVSGTAELLFGRTSVEGALYYWAAVQEGGIIRYDFGKPDQQAESFYTRADSGRCVACHALSPDGTRMALTFDGGDGPAGILDVESRTLTADSTYKANFQVYTPDNKHLIASHKGVLTVRDPVDGSAQTQLDTGGKATMPEVAPSGSHLAFVRPQSHQLDWSFGGGSIVTAPLNGQSLGASTVLVQGSATENNYYPAYSPDGEWIIFNRSTGDSYSDDDASLLVIAPAGGAPLPLARANQGPDLRNSWARWSPFEQRYKGRKLLWFTFSSTRDYGTALVNSDKSSDQRNPQIWMAAFDPEKAAAGQDPSFPAFWLPFQDITTNNHIAQWTEKAIGLQ